jgi:hypothetical protein
VEWNLSPKNSVCAPSEMGKNQARIGKLVSA